jgi:hypothetical protein
MHAAEVQAAAEGQEVQEVVREGELGDGDQEEVQEEGAKSQRHIQPDSPQGNHLGRRAPERRGFEWARWIRSRSQATATYHEGVENRRYNR